MLSIEYLRELVITFGRVLGSTPHWLTWLPGAAATLVFAAIAGFSLRAARKANELTSQIALQRLIMEDIADIAKVTNPLSFSKQEAKRLAQLKNISQTVVEKVSFSAFFPITSEFIVRIGNSYKHKDMREKVEPLVDALHSRLIDIAQLSLKKLKERRDFENEKYEELLKMSNKKEHTQFVVDAYIESQKI